MLLYLFYWLIASLVMPLATLLAGKYLNDVLIVVFWPGGISLMSLGGQKRSFEDVLYVWGTAVGSNIILYLIIGLCVYFLRTKIGGLK